MNDDDEGYRNIRGKTRATNYLMIWYFITSNGFPTLKTAKDSINPVVTEFEMAIQ